MNSIGKITYWLYPSVFFTNMLVGKSLVLNILAVFVVSVLAMAIAYFIIKKIILNTQQNLANLLKTWISQTIKTLLIKE